MQLPLIKNALDSLRFGKEFYQRYFELEDDKYNADIIPGYLKMAVLSFQHCLELFNKQLLMDIDSKLIINQESEEDYEKAKANCEVNGIKFRVENFILSELYSFRTIDYIKTVDRIEEHFQLNKEEKNIAIELGNIRNRLTHFGLDVTLDFYRVLRTINDTIRLILEFYYDNLKKSSRQIEYYYSADFEELYALLEEGERTEAEAWAVYYSDNFIEINYAFSSLFDEVIEREIEELGYSVEIDLGEYSDSDKLKMKVFTVEGTLLKELYTMNIPRMDATVLKEAGDDDIILLVINHPDLLLEEPENCYVYYNFNGFSEPLDYAKEFWEFHATRKQGRCKKVKFSKDTLQAQIKNYLNKRLKKERLK